MSFIGASSTSLTLSWPRAKGATSYEILRSTRESMAYSARAKTTTSPSATVTGLQPGKTYCFQVRARAGSSIGGRSAHTCKPTIRSQAGAAGRPVSVMTLNACADVCSGWSRRRAATRTLITERKPDVIAAQEAGAWTTAPSGYANAYYKSAKRLFYKKSRYAVATASGRKRAGSITLSPKKYAVWAELVDRSTHKRIIYVSVHTTATRKAYALRGREVKNLLSRVATLNYGKRSVVFAGDFNSTKNRGTYSDAAGFGTQDSVGRTFAASGYYDSYDLARSLKRPNWNSYNGGKAKPTIGRTWGDHVDHVYVRPGRTNVARWMNAALYVHSRYRAPLPSDHSAVQVDLYIP